MRADHATIHAFIHGKEDRGGPIRATGAPPTRWPKEARTRLMPDGQGARYFHRTGLFVRVPSTWRWGTNLAIGRAIRRYFERSTGRTSVVSSVERKTRYAASLRHNDRGSTQVRNTPTDARDPPAPTGKALDYVSSWLRVPRMAQAAMAAIRHWHGKPVLPSTVALAEGLPWRTRTNGRVTYPPRDTQRATLSNRYMKAIRERLGGTSRAHPESASGGEPQPKRSGKGRGRRDRENRRNRP